jgi:hypothetical protein
MPGPFPLSLNLLVLRFSCSILAVWKQRNVSVLVLDRPCGLELFRVNIEEPTSEGPSLELWECAMGHRTYYVSKEEDSISRAEN